VRWHRRDGRLVCVQVVEDDDAVRAVVQRILTKAGYQVL
jgi:FixJ family two-component response regulator